MVPGQFGFRDRGLFLDPPIYAIVARGGVSIHFGKGDTDIIHTNEFIRCGSMEAWILVTGIDALYEEFVSRGLDVPYEPTRRVYERTEIEITDCDGHKLVFGE